MYKRIKTGSKFLGALAIAALLGCGGKQTATPEVANKKMDAQPEEVTASEPPATTTANPEVAEAAGAQAAIVEDGTDSEAARCVAIFLDSLRRGDQRAVNAVLTQKAREELAKTSYVIEPLGAPDGKFEIGRVAYPYEDKSVALVECVWTDPPMGDQPAVSMDVVCEVHKEPEGWRMSALGLTIPGTHEALVLDFEDAQALEATINAVLGNEGDSVAQSGGSDSPQKAAGANTGSSATPASAATAQAESLPPLPNNSLRSVGTPAAEGPGSVDRIALPPVNGEPERR